MSATTFCAQLRELRQQPLWGLLRADKAPATIALLSATLLGEDKVLASSALRERVAYSITQLRGAGEQLERPAQAYIADWLASGWLTRRFPVGSAEEIYELSSDAVNAIRYLQSILQPRAAATESRLHTVILQLSRLAEETDDDPQSRLEALLAERARIDREIEAVNNGVITVLPPDRALERAREIIALADELTSDFRRVRDAFADLARNLRQSLVEGDESRAEILEQLFSGIDVIAQSEEGRSFAAFWRLLTDPVQSGVLNSALREVIARPFCKDLARQERRFLARLTSVLSSEGGGVQDVQQTFARSLKSFVQSREYLEHRRVNGLLNEALRSALSMNGSLRPGTSIGFTLTLAHAQIRSASQASLDDADARPIDPHMEDGALAILGLDAIADMLRHSEIDFRALRARVAAALEDHTQISVAQLLELHPAEQGLGSVIGYLALGAKHGEIGAEHDRLRWVGLDGCPRSALAPAVYFLRERAHELS